jgi:adenine-specific DNA-methyltransferase
MDNKAAGSFYTPTNLIDYMVSYAKERIAPHNILEPSAGDGRFVKPLKVFGCPITLIEIDEEKANDLKRIILMSVS